MKTGNKDKKTAVLIGATGNLGTALVSAMRGAGYDLDQKWIGADHPDCAKASSYEAMPKHIDLAVYAAGINLVKPVQDMTEDDWDSVVNVNLKGAFLFARAAYEGLRAAGGTFITVTSMNARYPYPNRCAYTASKAGLEGLTRQLAVEWGKYKISTVAIRLGPLNKLMKTTTTTPAILEAVRKRLPLGELIPPEAVADYIVWLGNGNAEWITGSVVDFDAGYTVNVIPLI